MQVNGLWAEPSIPCDAKCCVIHGEFRVDPYFSGGITHYGADLLKVAGLPEEAFDPKETARQLAELRRLESPLVRVLSAIGHDGASG